MVTSWEEAGELGLPQANTEGWVKLSILTGHVIAVVIVDGMYPYEGPITARFFPNGTMEMGKGRRQWLKDERKKLNLSQRKTANLAGISKSTVSRMERGIRIRYTTAERVYNALST